MSLSFIISGLIIIGFLLVLIEIFLVPGINIFGVVGFIFIVLGIVFAYSKLDLRVANFIMIASLIVSVVLVKMVMKSKTWHRMILNDRQEKSEGFHASSEDLSGLVGKTGVAYTNLRPAGVAFIDGQKVDVVTQGDLIEKDRAIEVIQVEGNRVVVRVVA
jgi:membrane-bound serine protease (ClpP class)